MTINYQDKYPLVSIAIITFNQKEFLRQCIESCLVQDYPNIEIVVADDCSTDGTQEMLAQYSRDYSNKFVLRLGSENKGITKNSNEAHFACSGKYIAWMGGDDVMLPGKISRQVNFMENNPKCTLCYHDLDVFNSETDETLFFWSKKVKPIDGEADRYIRSGVVNGACSTMVRADKIPQHGFNESIPVASDWLYWVECLISGGTINHIPEILGRYRRHSNNVTKENGFIGQNSVDHLNSCNFILAKRPCLIKDIMYRYADNMFSLRKKGLYFQSVLYSMKINFRFKYLLSICVYIFTFGLIKL
ncbi:glycosyltransferase [Marinomonas sp.]|uniref:glycosyltransferase n=1 Tax=Marinomonas sp. TaxID=1904862 RepID=UPI003A943449